MKKLKVILIALVVISLAVFGAAMSQKNGSSGPRLSKTTLGKEVELTAEQEADMIDVFSQCGIGEIVSASTVQKGEEKTSYHLKDSETQSYRDPIVVWVINETKVVDAIYYGDYDIYVNGSVIAQITDYYIDSTERDEYRLMAQMAVNQVLSFPDTAKYPSIGKWKFGVEDETTIVQSTVTAKNALNAEIEMKFQVKFNGETVVSLILDGKEYVTK